MKTDYPYRYVTGSVSTATGVVAKVLEKVGATDIYMAHSKAEVYFRLNDKPFVVKFPIGLFHRLNGGDEKKALRQAWSALRDYVKALVIRMQCTISDGDYWKAISGHLLTERGAAAEDMLIAAVEKKKLRLSLPAPEPEINGDEI